MNCWFSYENAIEIVLNLQLDPFAPVLGNHGLSCHSSILSFVGFSPFSRSILVTKKKKKKQKKTNKD